MSERGCVPEALFVPHLQEGGDQEASLVGLLFLLKPGVDPARQGAALAPELGPLDHLPANGTVMPIWSDDTDAWDCDPQAFAEMRGQLPGAAVVLVAVMEDPLGQQQMVYRQLPADAVTEARASLNEALGQAMH